MHWPLFTPGKEPVPIVQEAGWAPRPVWTSAENLTPTGIQFPDRPARSQSLYRLHYLAHPCFIHISVHLLVLVWGEESLHCYKFFNSIHSDMHKKQFRTHCYSFIANKCSQVNLTLCLKPWVKAYRKHRHRIPGIHDLATSSPGQEHKMDKMYTGPQGCYKQVGKVKEAMDITIHEGV
jgi:hypothetical protein